jgi:deazaflavin-dependent oxidoreductase (nitroreductase family)
VGSERRHNPFLNSATGGRALSAMQLPIFTLRPPPGYGVLTTTGRKSGRKRRRCVRAVRRGDRAYVVAIKGSKTGWLKNIEANPEVRLRIRGGTFQGRAQLLSSGTERAEARGAYSEAIGHFERLEYRMWRTGRPTPEAMRALHRGWFDHGVPVAIDLETPA